MARQTLVSYLDTNVVVFLHSGLADRVSVRAAQQIESTDLLISSMVLLELEMLHEKGILNYSASQILSDLNQQLGLSVCQLPMAAIIACAVRLKWTREPGDRMIVANAIAANEAPLVTSDRQIQKEYLNAIW